MQLSAQTATQGRKNCGSGIIVITGPPSVPCVHSQRTIPTGKWCSFFKAVEKAEQTALKLILEDVSLHKVRIVADSMSTLQRMQNLHQSQLVADFDENKIL